MRGVFLSFFSVLMFPLITLYGQTMVNEHTPLSTYKTFAAKFPSEKAYLHFDKPYYAAGDTIYFKAYVALGNNHRLSDLSGVLHVDLINTQNKIDRSIKLPINNGVAWGDFALADSLPQGNYRIRAYTRWMQNEGNDAFFEKTIPVGSLQSNKVPESAAAAPNRVAGKPDVQFFPEGGVLVAGIRAQVAFKAIGPDGAGIDVKGELTENDSKVVTSFASTHLGMGSFYFTPEAGKTYTIKTVYAGADPVVSLLPKAAEEGITLAVNNDSLPKASVTITASSGYFRQNRNKQFSLLIASGGAITSVPCTLDSSLITLDILKRHLKTGIASVTLFSPDNQPLCERLFFVQNYDLLHIHISSDKQSYAKRENVQLHFGVRTRADSAAAGHFSVSVTNEAIVPVEENKERTILTDLLLTSDLKGFIEQPDYYFIDPSSKTNADLDLVMLTHGYRRFDWKKILNNDYPPIAFQPEKGLEINGMAKTLMGKDVVNGTVSLIPLNGGPLLTSTTDDKGNFSFNNLQFADSTRFELSATKAKGSNLTKLIYLKDKDEPQLIAANWSWAIPENKALEGPYLHHAEKVQEQLNLNGLGKGKMLKEVAIKASKIAPATINGQYGVADQVIRGDQIRYGGSLGLRLMGLGNGLKFRVLSGNRFIPQLKRSVLPMLIVWNGQEMPADFDLSTINTGSIESIEIMTSATAAKPGFEGVMIIKTNFGTQAKDLVSTGVLSIVAKGFYQAREFYTPKYDHPNDDLKRPDLRSTIYWQPELITDKHGEAALNFYNADGTGTYRVVMEGIDENGNLGRTVYRYKVE